MSAEAAIGPATYTFIGAQITADTPAEVSHDDGEFDADVSVTNDGEHTYDDEIELLVDGTVVDTRPIELGGGETEAFSLTYELRDEEVGQELDVDVVGAHDTTTETVSVVGFTEYAVALDEDEFAHDVGDDELRVAGTVRNDGDSNATDPFDVTVDVDEGSITAVEADIDGLDAGATHEFDVAVDGGALDDLGDGSYDLVVAETRDGSEATAALTVHTPSGGDDSTSDDGTSSTSGGSSSSGGTSTTSPAEGAIRIEDREIAGQRGDLVEINVSAHGGADEGTLVFGDEEATGYEATVPIETFGDADAITLRFNTYAAGLGVLPVVRLDEESAAAGARIDVEPADDQTTDRDEILDAGRYEVRVSPDDAATARTDPTDVRTVDLAKRGTDAVGVWTAPGAAVEPVLDADMPLEEDRLTRTDRVAVGDGGVLRIEAGGLTGLLAAIGAAEDVDDPTERFRIATTDGFAIDGADTDGDDANGARTGDEENALDLRIRETRSSSGADASRRVVDLLASEWRVVVDDAAGTLFLVLDTDEVVFADGTEATADVDAEFDVAVDVHDERLLEGDEADGDADADGGDEVTADRGRTAATTFALVERRADFDADPYDVRPAEEQVFGGDASVAPGTGGTVRVSSTEPTSPSFAESAAVTVTPDGTWSVPVDFSDRSHGDTFRVTLHGFGISEPRPYVAGTVVGASETRTERTSGSAPKTTRSSDAGRPTGTAEATGSGTATGTPTGTEAARRSLGDRVPGAGALLSVFVLLAIALIAVRGRP